MKKSARMLAAAMAAVMMLTACGSGSAGSTTAAPAGDSKAAETQAEAGTEAKESGAAEGEKAGADGVLKVALILPGKKDDVSFNQAMFQGMQKYVDAKFRITQNQTPEDAFIFWNDDPIIKRELDKHGLRAHLYPFAAVKEDGAIAYVEDGEVEINEPIAFNMEQEELALHGTHNLYNSLAAGISANLAGIRKEYIRKALSDFKGVEHRLEKVATVRGVNFINDSKATNVNSCWYALQSMTGKTVLILGGKDKGNDYTEIEDLVREKCSALVYLGLHNEKLHDFFDRLGLPVADVQTGMKDAVEAAFKLAKKGETVLLSPCCASFDLFKSYEDRGEQFKVCVRAL